MALRTLLQQHVEHLRTGDVVAYICESWHIYHTNVQHLHTQ